MLTLLSTESASGGPGTHALTIPGTTTHAVVAVTRGGATAVSIGGVALTAASSPGIWYGDLTARSGSNLVFTAGSGDNRARAIFYFTANDLQPFDDGSASGTSPFTVDETRTSALDGSNVFAVLEGGGGSADVLYDVIDTLVISFSESGNVTGIAKAGPGANDASVQIRATTGSATGASTRYVFFHEAQPEQNMELARAGEVAGFRGLTVAATGPATNYLSRRPAEVTGFRPLTIRASGPRQVALVGRHLGTSEMTEGGTEGQVLTYHAASKPTWEDSTGGGADGSLLIDLSVSGAHTADRDDAATHDLTLTDDATITPDHSAAVAGEAIDLRLLIRQDGTGGHTLAWGGTISWVGGTAPTMPTDPDTLLTVGLLSVDDATTWLGYVADDDVAGTPATTVESETTWGITPAVGTDTEYARQDHTHGTPAEPSGGGIGPLLIADDHSTPLIFGDLLQTEEGDDLLYFDGG